MQDCKWHQLRILAVYYMRQKNSKICDFWTFWPVIQLINHHLKICYFSSATRCHWMSLNVTECQYTFSLTAISQYTCVARDNNRELLAEAGSTKLGFWAPRCLEQLRITHNQYHFKILVKMCSLHLNEVVLITLLGTSCNIEPWMD